MHTNHPDAGALKLLSRIRSEVEAGNYDEQDGLVSVILRGYADDDEPVLLSITVLKELVTDFIIEDRDK